MTNIFERTIYTLRRSRKTQSAPVPDDLMREENPLLSRNDLHQVLLDLLWIVVLRQFQSSRDAMDVGVHDQTFGLAEPGAQDDVGGFAGHSWQREQVIHVLGNLAAELADDFSRRANNRFRFIAKKTG